MKIKSLFTFYILTSCLFSQLDFGANYELKYFDGKEDASDVLENYLDLNVYYNDWYLYSLFRFKDPALIGSPTKTFDEIYNVFYFEYYNNNLQLQIGDIFQSYGAGLSMHTYEDRAIDYNNALRGVNILYYLRDDIDLFSMVGSNTFSSRTSPSILEPNIFLDNQIALFGFNYQNDLFDMHYLSQFNNQSIDSTTISNMKNYFDNSLGDYLEYRYQNSSLIQDFNMKILEHNLGTTFYIKDLELYLEKSWIYHNKIGGERNMGYKMYLSSYFSINGYGFLYEYKNYNTPYYYSVYSNPPIVFRESNSTLISRNLHNVDFSNEIGHHILINKSFSDQLNLVFSTACSFTPLMDNNSIISGPSYDQILSKMLFQKGDMSEYQDFKPYRQLYLEFNGITENEKIFYKIGFDKYLEYANGKIINTRTIPTQFTLKLKKGNSISAYLEHQVYEDLSLSDKKYYAYFSPSYNHYGKWILSFFGDFDMKTKLLGVNDLKDGYLGLDFTYYITNNNILSVFVGSQKGGLVCANGTCVMQPDFDNGFKVTSKIIF